MAFNPIKTFSKLWKAINAPDNLVKNTMFNALKKPVYKLAYQTGVKVQELASFLKEQGAKNIPSNMLSDVDNFYRQQKNALPLGNLDKDKDIPFDLITREEHRRQRKYRYIVDGTKFDFGSGAMETGTYSFWTDSLISLQELESQANEKRLTIDKYQDEVQAYQLNKLIAVVENTKYIEPKSI